MTLVSQPGKASEVHLVPLIAELSGYTALAEAPGAHRAAETIHRFEGAAHAFAPASGRFVAGTTG